MHSVDSIFDATTGGQAYGDTALAIAGPGAPLVAELAVAEFAAALGMSTDAGHGYLGEAVDLRYRLPRVWRRVVEGDVPPGRPAGSAASTIALTRDAAAFVDTHVSHVARKIGPFQLARLVDEAIIRFMPGEAEKRRQAAVDARHVTIDTRDTSLAGTTSVWGELARHQQTLDLTTQTAAEQAAPARKARQVVLYVHLSDAAVTNPGLDRLGRLENTRNPITAEQVRSWCANPDTHVTVKPVIDLADHVRVEQYEVPDRMAEAAVLVDVTCAFPCTRPARGCGPDQHHADS